MIQDSSLSDIKAEFDSYFWGDKDVAFDFLYNDWKTDLEQCINFSNYLDEYAVMFDNISQKMKKMNKHLPNQDNYMFSFIWRKLSQELTALIVIFKRYFSELSNLSKDVTAFSNQSSAALKKFDIRRGLLEKSLNEINIMKENVNDVDKKMVYYKTYGKYLNLSKDKGSNKQELIMLTRDLNNTENDYQAAINEYNQFIKYHLSDNKYTIEIFYDTKIGFIQTIYTFLQMKGKYSYNFGNMYMKIVQENNKNLVNINYNDMMIEFAQKNSTGMKEDKFALFESYETYMRNKNEEWQFCDEDRPNVLNDTLTDGDSDNLDDLVSVGFLKQQFETKQASFSRNSLLIDEFEEESTLENNLQLKEPDFIDDNSTDIFDDNTIATDQIDTNHEETNGEKDIGTEINEYSDDSVNFPNKPTRGGENKHIKYIVKHVGRGLKKSKPLRKKKMGEQIDIHNQIASVSDVENSFNSILNDFHFEDNGEKNLSLSCSDIYTADKRDSNKIEKIIRSCYVYFSQSAMTYLMNNKDSDISLTILNKTKMNVKLANTKIFKRLEILNERRIYRFNVEVIKEMIQEYHISRIHKLAVMSFKLPQEDIKPPVDFSLSTTSIEGIQTFYVNIKLNDIESTVNFNYLNIQIDTSREFESEKPCDESWILSEKKENSLYFVNQLENLLMNKISFSFVVKNVNNSSGQVTGYLNFRLKRTEKMDDMEIKIVSDKFKIYNSKYSTTSSIFYLLL
ncbi:hypothetical protein A3Q56_02609 [Intoshia linei]|uniref:FCH domain-containing protein n=1 Tax=Intoshia linei TaxID=1819745 RepID=A0A177B7K1_9BILA|nr:hypothetical protein A3Q56_02609 [Intoshia linei]